VRSEAALLTERLAELRSAEAQKESSLLEELRKTKDALLAKDTAIKALEEELDQNAELEGRLQEQQQLLKTRDTELAALRSEAIALTGRLAELGSVEAQKESFLHEELSRTKEALRGKDSTIEALEEKLALNAELENQLQEQQRVLEARDTELEALRSKANSLTARLALIASAEGEKGVSLLDELAKAKEALEVKDADMKMLEEELDRRVKALESELTEKEKLLQTRNKEFEKLAADLKEKKLVLAKQEIADFQSMKRRNIWKRRFAKLRFPEKSN
jgi:predicted butyrate kinase (DUF1464 family)